MKTTATALRAVTARFMRRLMLIAAIGVGLIALVIFTLIATLAATLSQRWWLLLIPFIPLVLLAAGLGLLLWIATRRLYPHRLTRSQKNAIDGFAGKIFGVLAALKLPLPAKFALIGKDILRGKPSALISETIDSTRTLRAEFESLRKEL